MHRFDVFFPRCVEYKDIFNDASRIRDIVKDIGHPAAVVVTDVHHPERKSWALVPSDWSRKCDHGCALFIQRHLVVSFKGVYHCEEFHPRWDGSNRLEWRLVLESWADDAFIQCP